jgi:hypothetical protein
MKELIDNLLVAEDAAAYQIASQACTDYFAIASESEKKIIKKAILKKAELDLKKSIESRRIAEDLIAQFDKKEVIIEVDGQKYPLKDWVTIKEYCKLFNVKNTMIVSNWISRSIIPKENVLHLRELNNIKLIKAVKYMS